MGAMIETDQQNPSGGYGKVMALIGSGHALSHYYFLVLPPLFPLLKVEFGVSYAALGLLLSLMNIATGVCQIPAGLLVDRLGAKPVLMAGLLISGVATAAMGLASGYMVLAVLALLSGVGNSVFHPADYSILSASVEDGRHGRAFALHTFTGNVGFMVAPATIILLASLWGWRGALIASGLAAVAVFVFVGVAGGVLHDEGRERRERGADAGPDTRPGIGPMLTPTILSLFMFFVCTSLVTGGVQAFSVTALIEYQGLGLGSANSVLTAYLVMAGAGILLGGPLADKSMRHGLIAGGAMVFGAIVMVAIGSLGMPMLLLLGAFAAVGLTQGMVRPARDMLVKQATPPGATGRVFAFVSTGLNVGAAVTPVLFGYIIDLGHPALVFHLLGAILLFSITTLGLAQYSTRAALAAVSR